MLGPQRELPRRAGTDQTTGAGRKRGCEVLIRARLRVRPNNSATRKYNPLRLLIQNTEYI